MNSEFVTQFISECAQSGLTTPEQICNEARRLIAEIDEQVKYRIKLSDVLVTFREIEPQKKDEARTDKQPSIIDRKLATDAMEIIGNRKMPIQALSKFFEKFSDDYKRNLIYTIKCMIENDVLCRSSDGIIEIGEKHSEFFSQ